MKIMDSVGYGYEYGNTVIDEQPSKRVEDVALCYVDLDDDIHSDVVLC